MIKCKEYKAAQVALTEDILNVIRYGYYCGENRHCDDCEYFYEYSADGAKCTACMIEDLLSEIEKVRDEIKAEEVEHN